MCNCVLKPLPEYGSVFITGKYVLKMPVLPKGGITYIATPWTGLRHSHPLKCWQTNGKHSVCDISLLIWFTACKRSQTDSF